MGTSQQLSSASQYGRWSLSAAAVHLGPWVAPPGTKSESKDVIHLRDSDASFKDKMYIWYILQSQVVAFCFFILFTYCS